MLLDIAFAFLVILGYLVAIIMATKTKAQPPTIDIDTLAKKIAEQLNFEAAQARASGKVSSGAPYKPDPFMIELDESPVVVAQKTEGLELAGVDLGETKETEEKVDTSKLAALKGKK